MLWEKSRPRRQYYEQFVAEQVCDSLDYSAEEAVAVTSSPASMASAPEDAA